MGDQHRIWSALRASAHRPQAAVQRSEQRDAVVLTALLLQVASAQRLMGGRPDWRLAPPCGQGGASRNL